MFEKIVKDINTNPTFVASVLCSSITNLERSGLDSDLLKNEEIFKSFQLLEEGKIAKESIEMVFENIMAGKSKTIEEAMENASIQSVSEDELGRIIEAIIEKNEGIIKNQKERAIGPLMGIAMKELRGKVSGETINKLLLQNIKKKIENN